MAAEFGVQGSEVDDPLPLLPDHSQHPSPILLVDDPSLPYREPVHGMKRRHGPGLFLLATPNGCRLGSPCCRLGGMVAERVVLSQTHTFCFGRC